MKLIPFVVSLCVLTENCCGQLLLEHVNYWEMTFQIVRSEELRIALEISPKQRAEIAELRGSEAMQRFVDMTGNQYESNLNPMPIGSGEMPQQFIHVDSDCLTSDDAECTLQLSKRQSMQLQSIRSEYHTAITKLPSENRHKAFDSLQLQFDRSIREVLVEQQLRQVLRKIIDAEFKRDFRAPFYRAEINTYLQLDAQQTDAVRVAAEMEYKSFQTKVRQLDAQVFHQLCGELPHPSRQQMEQLFHDVWLIPLESYSWSSQF